MSEIPSSRSLSILSRRARFARPSLDLSVLEEVISANGPASGTIFETGGDFLAPFFFTEKCFACCDML